MTIPRDRKTNMAFGHLIQQLYGQKYFYNNRKRQSISKARKTYIKILTTYKLTIQENIIVADRVQIEELNKIIDLGIERLKLTDNFEFLDNSFICTQSMLILQLLGDLPDRWSNKSIPNRKEFWRINSNRQIQYIQTSKQKENLIISYLQTKYSDRFPDIIKFYIEVIEQECKHDIGAIQTWMHNNYPDIDLNIF